MSRAFEYLAESYLKRRGRLVVPRCFIGVIVGNAIVTGKPDKMLVSVPFASEVIALNGSIVTWE
jgi:hypothetical protein